MTEIEHNGTVAMTDTQAGIAGNVTDEMVEAFLDATNMVWRGADDEAYYRSQARDGLSAALASQSAQPVLEPVAIGVFRNNEMIGFVGGTDMRDEYRLPEDTDDRRFLYLHPAPSQEPVAVVKALTVRHKKRGTLYSVVGYGEVQTDTPLEDYTKVVVYRGVSDGNIWIRPVSEFEDGRFEDASALVNAQAGKVEQ